MCALYINLMRTLYNNIDDGYDYAKFTRRNAIIVQHNVIHAILKK